MMTKAASNGELATSNMTIKRGVYTSPLMRFDLSDCNVPWYAWDMKKIKEDIYIAKPIKYIIRPITVIYPILFSAG